MESTSWKRTSSSCNLRLTTVRTLFSRLVQTLSSPPKALQSRNELLLENLALRQQLVVLKIGNTRLRLCRFDRVFWVFFRRFWSKWSDSLIIVQALVHCSEEARRWGER